MDWYGSNKLIDTLSPIVLGCFIRSKNISSLVMIFFSKMSELSYSFRCVGFFFFSVLHQTVINLQPIIPSKCGVFLVRWWFSVQ